MDTSTLKSLIFNRYGLFPIFIFNEIDWNGDEFTFTIDTMNLEPGTDDFLVRWTADNFMAMMMNECEMEINNENSFLDTSYSEERLKPRHEHDHEHRTRVRMTLIVKLSEAEEDFNKDITDDD